MLRTIYDGILNGLDMLRTICEGILSGLDMLRTICDGILNGLAIHRTICDGILNGLAIHRTICDGILSGLDMLRMICEGIKTIDSAIVLFFWSGIFLLLHIFKSDISILISFIVIWIDFNGFIKICNCFIPLSHTSISNSTITISFSIF